MNIDAHQSSSIHILPYLKNGTHVEFDGTNMGCNTPYFHLKILRNSVELNVPHVSGNILHLYEALKWLGSIPTHPPSFSNVRMSVKHWLLRKPDSYNVFKQECRFLHALWRGHREYIKYLCPADDKRTLSAIIPNMQLTNITTDYYLFDHIDILFYLYKHNPEFFTPAVITSAIYRYFNFNSYMSPFCIWSDHAATPHQIQTIMANHLHIQNPRTKLIRELLHQISPLSGGRIHGMTARQILHGYRELTLQNIPLHQAYHTFVQYFIRDIIGQTPGCHLINTCDIKLCLYIRKIIKRHFPNKLPEIYHGLMGYLRDANTIIRCTTCDGSSINPILLYTLKYYRKHVGSELSEMHICLTGSAKKTYENTRYYSLCDALLQKYMQEITHRHAFPSFNKNYTPLSKPFMNAILNNGSQYALQLCRTAMKLSTHSRTCYDIIDMYHERVNTKPLDKHSIKRFFRPSYYYIWNRMLLNFYYILHINNNPIGYLSPIIYSYYIWKSPIEAFALYSLCIYFTPSIVLNIGWLYDKLFTRQTSPRLRRSNTCDWTFGSPVNTPPRTGIIHTLRNMLHTTISNMLSWE